MSPRIFLNTARRTANRVRIRFGQDPGQPRQEPATSSGARPPSRAAARRKTKPIRRQTKVQTVGPLARNRGFESISLHQRVSVGALFLGRWVFFQSAKRRMPESRMTKMTTGRARPFSWPRRVKSRPPKKRNALDVSPLPRSGEAWAPPARSRGREQRTLRDHRRQ